MVTAQFGPYKATIEGYKWSVPESESMEKLLNASLHPYGPSGSDPYPDLTAAREAVEELGGKVLDWDDIEPIPEGTII